jgi:tripartite-type tricarboxylate transporter receptor subunit TctC
MRAAKVTAVIGFWAQLLLLSPLNAADYPSRPIKLLVGASAGGTTDTMARTIAEPLSSLFGQPVLVENRPGAGGNLAAEAVAPASRALRSTQRSIRNCHSIRSPTLRRSR